MYCGEGSEGPAPYQFMRGAANDRYFCVFLEHSGFWPLFQLRASWANLVHRAELQLQFIVDDLPPIYQKFCASEKDLPQLPGGASGQGTVRVLGHALTRPGRGLHHPGPGSALAAIIRISALNTCDPGRPRSSAASK